MSATGRGAERRPNDWYGTPAWCVERLLEDANFRAQIPDPADPTGGDPCWLEPCAGDGAIIRACQKALAPTGDRVRWTAMELRPRDLAVQSLGAPSTWRAQWGVDFLTQPTLAPESGLDLYDLCITNPPYTLAQAFVTQALTVAEHVVMLLRLNFLESQKRVRWWTEVGLPDVYVLPNRPSFTGHGTDACAYGWFHWSTDWSKKRLGHLSILRSTPEADR